MGNLPSAQETTTDQNRRATSGRATRLHRGARQRVSRRGRTPPCVPLRRLFAFVVEALGDAGLRFPKAALGVVESRNAGGAVDRTPRNRGAMFPQPAVN